MRAEAVAPPAGGGSTAGGRAWTPRLSQRPNAARAGPVGLAGRTYAQRQCLHSGRPVVAPLRRGAPRVCSASGTGAAAAAEEAFVLEPIGDGTCYHLRDGQQFPHAAPISFPLEDGRVVVGRKDAGKADLGIDVGSLSARHAEFIVARGRLFIKDLGSTNGTMVNDRYLSAGEERRLKAGQVVILGDEHLAAFRVTMPGQSTDGFLGALSGIFSDSAPVSKQAKAAPDVVSISELPQPAGEATPGGQAKASSRPSSAEPDAGQVAGAVILGTASCGSTAPQDAIVAAQEALQSSTDVSPLPNTGAIEVVVPEPKPLEMPSTSSAVVTSPQGDKVTLQGEGAQVEKAGPFGIMNGLSEVTGRLGAAITNSQVQVNYQYKPVVQFNTGGKPLGPGEVKSTLLVGIAGKDRGLSVSENDVAKIEQLARALEAQNPTPAPLKSPLLNGRWALQYTTCKSALQGGAGGLLRPNGPIHQTVDIFNLKVLNEANFSPLPFLKWKNSASSNLSAQSNSRARVKPEQFRVGPFKVDAPPSSPARAALQWETNAMGASSEAWLDTTYLDADLRISRNSNGDVFVFVRDDPNDQ